MSGYQVGEDVDITIRRARIEQVTDLQRGGEESLGLDHPALSPRSFRVRTGNEEMTVTRSAPADWPPQVGDLWQDRHGDLWFAVNVGDDWTTGPDEDWRLVSLSGNAVYVHVAVDQHGPLALVRRETSKGGACLVHREEPPVTVDDIEVGVPYLDVDGREWRVAGDLLGTPVLGSHDGLTLPAPRVITEHGPLRKAPHTLGGEQG